MMSREIHLALGSFFFGRYIDRFERPLGVFALLEAGIGLYASRVTLEPSASIT